MEKQVRDDRVTAALRVFTFNCTLSRLATKKNIGGILSVAANSLDHAEREAFKKLRKRHPFTKQGMWKIELVEKPEVEGDGGNSDSGDSQRT